MPWIELKAPKKINGRERNPGFRCEYPYHAAMALIASRVAEWCDGPHKPADEGSSDSEQGQEVEDQGDPVEDDHTQDQEPEPAEDAGESDESGYPDPDEFAALETADQKDLIRDLGLEEKCDLRKPLEMAIAYGAWHEEQ